MPKRATTVVLSEKEQEGLLQITKRHRSEQQVVLRAHIVLAAVQGSSNAQIARELGINVDTVRLWRDRWVGLLSILMRKLLKRGNFLWASRLARPNLGVHRLLQSHYGQTHQVDIYRTHLIAGIFLLQCTGGMTEFHAALRLAASRIMARFLDR